MQCESCFEKEAEVDGLLDGEYKKLCRPCAVMDGAVIVPPASNKSIHDLYKRATVREVLMRMSGIERPSVTKRNPHLDDLRQVKRTLDKERQSFDSEVKVLSGAPAQATATEIEEEKKGFFSKLFSFGKKEKTPNPQEEPRVDFAEQSERLRQVRSQLSADEVLEL